MPAPLRLIMFGLGPIGAAITRLLLEKPNAEIVAAIDADPAKAGQDLGTVIGLDRLLGVSVSGGAAAVLGMHADVVVHCTGSSLVGVRDQLTECLAAGYDVVSSCEELSYPYHKHPALSRELDDLARRHDVTLHGTGVNPGFVMDKLPVTLSSMCQRVDAVQVTRIVDAGRRRLPLQKKVGAGITPAAFEAEVAAGRIKHHGLPESAAMIAHTLGFAVDEITEEIGHVLAERPITTEFLTVEPGQVAGVRQVCVGTVEGRVVVRLELQMYVGAAEPADTIQITGVPDLRLVIPGGTHGDLATAAALVNAIPVVRSAPCGLLTAADLPVHYASAFPVTP